MPLFENSGYYVHGDPEEYNVASPRSVNSDFFVNAKGIHKTKAVSSLNRLPPLYNYPKPVLAADNSSLASSDWVTTKSEPSTSRRRKHLPKLKNETTSISGRSYPNNSPRRSALNRDQFNVNFVSASDLNDFIERGTSHSFTQGARLGLQEVEVKRFTPGNAWSSRPLIKRQKDVPKKDELVPRTKPSRRRANLSKEGGLKGKTPMSITSDRKIPGINVRNIHDNQSDIDETESVSSARSTFIPEVEGEVLSNRKNATMKLVDNAIATLRKYDLNRTDPLDNIPKVHTGRQRKNSLDSIPEGEFEIQEDVLSDDGWSSYSGDSWSSARSGGGGGGRRQIRDRHNRLNLNWRPKSPVLSKPGLAMIPENEQNMDIHRKSKSPRHSNDYYDYTMKVDPRMERSRMLTERNSQANDALVRGYISESRQAKSMRNSKILYAREKLKNNPRKVKFLKT